MEGIEEIFIKNIRNHKQYPNSFKEITDSFEQKFYEFNPVRNSFNIEEYFGAGNRIQNASRMLIRDKLIQPEWLREYSTKKGNFKCDFKGLYVFIHNSTPFYVGISKGVIGRLCQHLKGRTHNNSTLAYRLGLLKYEYENGVKYNGERKDLNFLSNVEPAKQFLMKQKAALIAIEDDIELYLFEVFCSMKLCTWFNDYETH